MPAVKEGVEKKMREVRCRRVFGWNRDNKATSESGESGSTYLF